MEVVKNIGSILGYIISMFTLYALIKTKFLGTLGGYVKKEAGSDKYSEAIKEIHERLDQMDNTIKDFMESDKELKEHISKRLQNQNDACRQLLASVIEDTYYENRGFKTLDSVSLKRVVNAYSIYHEELKGNSYITSIYEEMMEWDHVN